VVQESLKFCDLLQDNSELAESDFLLQGDLGRERKLKE
jgi:hypothetical protein